jgi:NADH-quinone oxidoreductase subunit G
VLASWRMLLDHSSLQDDEPFLAGTAHAPVARLSPATAAEISLSAGDDVTVSTSAGSVSLPVVVTEMPDRVVWLPARSTGSHIHEQLCAEAGSVVRIAPGGGR